MRVSKEPEVRKQEILDTAMKLFAEKGYEVTTMTDIAKAVGVVSGLCYKYFSSKYELYQAALKEYVKEYSEPIIAILDSEEESFEAYMVKIKEYFIKTDGKEKYHDFFHKRGNEMFNIQLSMSMCENARPHMEQFLLRLKQKGFIRVKDYKVSAAFILYGEIPILNDENLTSAEKADNVIEIMKKIIM
ncbi:TetR/AcrR family transcriptional regulator [Anaerocolumna sp. MB42-C2]|uniref:TetR/AcrR family transcriptional regulator n=1 Tax=Anaerocolumna sp. MB42-C2 TaxID=3070997 RepID=UPI0027DF21B9|nr:TetR/AcrR family transcriptional regulator [Anaerocolumna sp. MB42-C2]WMJ87076.1 TetR/AcrR family transcriptional regulator [Anaerocolumna sp. MB42-C2]